MINWMICPVCGQPFDGALGQAFDGGLPLCPLCFRQSEARRREEALKRR